MLHVEKSTDSIVKGTFLLRRLLFAAVLLFPPISAHAQCADLGASGYVAWDLIDGDQRYRITLRKEGKAVEGLARFVYEDSNTIIGGSQVRGTIDGDSILVEMSMPNAEISGVYEGKVLPSGRIAGYRHKKGIPYPREPWQSFGVLTCTTTRVQSGTTRPSPIARSGRARPAAQPAAPPLVPPFITASPPIRIPFVPGASVYLGWDGGPDYPNADVWVSINNAPEISAALLYGPALKQPKIGGFELKLQGGLYKYFLKAAGTTLATVTVAVP